MNSELVCTVVHCQTLFFMFNFMLVDVAKSQSISLTQLFARFIWFTADAPSVVCVTLLLFLLFFLGECLSKCWNRHRCEQQFYYCYIELLNEYEITISTTLFIYFSLGSYICMYLCVVSNLSSISVWWFFCSIN